MKDHRLQVVSTLTGLGIDHGHALELRRIAMTLHNWHEAECGGGNDFCSWSIERDEITDKPYRVVHRHNEVKSRRYLVADKEAGALKRLATIIANYPDLVYYVQGDPRGASLYIIRKSDVEGKELDTCYSSRGVAVYK